jgi:hypothetical protein
MTIKARWRVRGLPFLSLLLRFYRKDKTDLYRYRNLTGICSSVHNVQI